MNLSAILEPHGITPSDYGFRTTCPKCSHTREKYWKRCLRIDTRTGWVTWECKHCGWEGVA